MKYVVVTLLGLGLAAIWTPIAQAQVSPDGTLGLEPSIVNGGIIHGGSRRGGNLFHSFSEFSIPTGQNFYFDNPNGVNNILSRVTGDRPSNIDGTLGVLGTANLFFINPNGLVFGPNSRLDMAGVFVGSTASSIQLADRTTYSAVAPAAPLLTMAVPTGLQFGAKASSIQLNNANDLLPRNIAEQDISRQGSGFILVGGDISLENSKLSIPGGKFEFAAVSPNSSVDINFAELANPHAVSISVSADQSRMDIRLLNGSQLRTTGRTSGDVSLIANNIEISGTLDPSNEQGRSAIETHPCGIVNNNSEKQGGNVTLDSTNNILINDYFAGVFTNPQKDSNINEGNIRVIAKDMQILNGARLGSNEKNTARNTSGKGGSISLTIQNTLELSSSKNGQESNINSPGVGSGKDGNGITIQTGQLIVKDGAQIYTDNSDGTDLDLVGKLGDINITATVFVRVSGVSSTITQYNFPKPTGITSFTANKKDSGNITIKTPRLIVEGGASISAGTDAPGKAGNISITGLDGGYASSVEVIGSAELSSFRGNPLFSGVSNGSRIRSISGSDKDSGDSGVIEITSDTLTVQSGARIEVGARGVGHGGTIDIVAKRLQLLDGGQLISTTYGTGNAGTVKVRATEAIDLNGNDEFFESRKALIQKLSMVDYTIRLNVGKSSGIVTESVSKPEDRAGTAGNINLTSPVIRLDRGKITAKSASSNGGVISLNVDRTLILRNQAEITASTTANGDGGNIRITAPNGLIVAVPRENSDVKASAMGGQGGRIDLQASNVLGFIDRRFPQFSNIDASSENGPQGIVTINNLGNDPSRGIQPEPIAPGAPDLSQVCPNSRNVAANGNEKRSNQFVNGGKGGVVASTSEPLRSASLWTDPTSTRVAQTNPPPSSTFSEAQGWVAGRNGTVLLTTQPTQPIEPTLQANRPNCYGH